MTEPRELIRSYLKGRETLGEPQLFLPAGSRTEVLERIRTASEESPGSVEAVADVQRLAHSGTRDEILAIADMAGLREVAESCSRCALHATRTKVVFADGPAEARVMCVGEAPGANEDRTGLPFVGRAGKLMDRLLLSVGFPRTDVFICNVLKCRPPGNRNPLPEEIEACSPFLLRQVAIVKPSVIVAFGTFAAQTLLGTRDSLRRLRGRTHVYEGYPLVVTYHPAALLRNPGWTRPTWADLQLARQIVDGERGPATMRSQVEEAAPSSDLTRESDLTKDQLVFGGRDG